MQTQKSDMQKNYFCPGTGLGKKMSRQFFFDKLVIFKVLKIKHFGDSDMNIV